jgi:hypothetical protein
MSIYSKHNQDLPSSRNTEMKPTNASHGVAVVQAYAAHVFLTAASVNMAVFRNVVPL